MQSLFDNFSLLLTTPPGNLAYYLVLTFSIVGALQGAFTAFSPDPAPRRRMILGLSFLLLVQVGLFVAAGFAWQGALPSVAALPVVDRAAALLSIVIFIWLWAFPQPGRAADAGMFLILVLVTVSLVMASVWWNEQPLDSPFNGSLADIALNGLALGVLALGALALLLRRPFNWGLGLAMLVLLALGHSLTLILTPAFGDFSGILRLAQLAAFPWLLALPRSLGGDTVSVPAAPMSRSVVPERRRYNLQPVLVQELLSVLREPDSPEFARSLVRIIAQMMLADYCLLLAPSGTESQILVAQAYNLIEEKHLDGFSVDSRLLPGIDSAMKRGRILRLPSGSTSADLTVLAQRLRLGRVGHLMVVPVAAPGEEPRMGFVVLSPYSNRSWAADDQTFLGQIAAAIASGPAVKPGLPAVSEDLRESDHSAEQTVQFSHQQETEIVHLRTELEQLRYQVADERARAETLAALVESQRQGAEAGADDPTLINSQYMENELRLTLRHVADLKQALADADQKLLDAQAPRLTATAISHQDRDDITGLVEDLRQPLASVVGNADMLLGESMGILGAFQKKFVERIRTGGERMAVLLDDLIQAVSLAGSGQILVPQPIDLNAMLDNAIEVAMVPLRGKNLTLRVDIPADLPAFRADPQSVQRILTNLLQNAGTCTPPEGEVALRAQAETPEHEPGYILIQVSDSGGGIASHDLPRVFSQSLKSETAAIQGLGTPPEPFSTTKALVEAHGGRIWVDSVAGRGATFSALFPIASEGLSVR